MKISSALLTATVILAISTVSCRKEPAAPAAPEFYSTGVSGRVFREFTGRPVADKRLFIVARRPVVREEICLFCPREYSETVDTFQTDAFGRFEGTIRTPADALSLTIWPENGSRGGSIPNLRSGNYVELPYTEIIALRQTIRVRNNSKPPLYINLPYSTYINVYSPDSVFTAYGYVNDTGITVQNEYHYFENGAARSKTDAITIGGFADTLTFDFTVDASTF